MLGGQRHGDVEISGADDFAYTDPVDGSVSRAQGIRLRCGDDARVVMRLSGTGTEGATLRVYLERFEPAGGNLQLDAQAALSDLIAAIRQLTEIEARTGRNRPTVIT